MSEKSPKGTYDAHIVICPAGKGKVAVVEDRDIFINKTLYTVVSSVEFYLKIRFESAKKIHSHRTGNGVNGIPNKGS